MVDFNSEKGLKWRLCNNEITDLEAPKMNIKWQKTLNQGLHWNMLCGAHTKNYART